jgi:hypothetical protein
MFEVGSFYENVREQLRKLNHLIVEVPTKATMGGIMMLT